MRNVGKQNVNWTENVLDELDRNAEAEKDHQRIMNFKNWKRPEKPHKNLNGTQKDVEKHIFFGDSLDCISLNAKNLCGTFCISI